MAEKIRKHCKFSSIDETTDEKRLVILVVILCLALSFTVVIAVLYFIKIKFFFNLNNNDYVNIFISSLVAFGTIFLYIATFYSLLRSFKQEKKRNEHLLNQYKEEHLNDIKSFLKLVQNFILNKFNNGTFLNINGNTMFDENSLKSIIDSERHLYDEIAIYNYEYNEIVNNKLYKDLKNHKISKDIPEKFESFLDSIKNNTPIYIKGLYDIILEIKKLQEYNILLNKINNKYNVPTVQELIGISIKESYVLILVSIFGYKDIKNSFRNYYDFIKKEVNGLAEIEKITEIIKNNDVAIKTVNYRNEIIIKLNELIADIKNVSDYDDLLDECPYLKRKRETIY